MSDYTPTAALVNEHMLEFDRWLADHDRQVKAEAWAEGWHAAGDAFIEGLSANLSGMPQPDSGDGPPNPYRT